MEVLSGNTDQELTVHHQGHSGVLVSTSYICIDGAFVSARVFRSHAEERQTVLLPKHDPTRGAVNARLREASVLCDHPLFTALVKLGEQRCVYHPQQREASGSTP